jgi:monoamine oxidase
MASDVMREPEPKTDVLVIGAGMAGVIAASYLTRAGDRMPLGEHAGVRLDGRQASRLAIGEPEGLN